MHESVMAWVQKNLKREEVEGKRVLEIGSMDVNGSVRPYVESLQPISYQGVDIRPGPGVDIVEDFGGPLSADEFIDYDLVISTECLEHCADWWRCVTNMKTAVTEGGLLLITTRSPGFPLHEYPGDYWRFRIGDFRQIFSDMEILVLDADPRAPGVFMKARRPEYPKDLSKIQVEKAPEK